jgi:hypothetical protein
MYLAGRTALLPAVAAPAAMTDSERGDERRGRPTWP